jgi:NitT/TauT family transport system substrate-binding protein
MRAHIRLLAVFLLLIVGRPADAADPVRPKLRLFLHWYAEADDGGFYAALENGYWKDEGLDVEIVQGGPNPNIEMHVSTEPATLGIVPADKAVLGAARGLPLVAFLPFYQHDAQAIMVHANSPVKSLADLSGRRVAVTFGATFFTYLQKHYHYQNTTVLPYTGTVANFIRDPEYIQQAFPHAEPFYAKQQGVESRCILVSESGFDPYRVVVAPQKMVSGHPEWLRAFSKGAYRGWIEFYRDPKRSLDAIQKLNPTADRPGLEFAVQEIKRYRFLQGRPDRGESFGNSDPARWEALNGQLVTAGLIPKPVDLKQVVSDAFTPAKLGVDVSSLSR